MSEHIALFAVGLLLLAAGAGCLVFGAARLDRATGRSAFAVGVVAVGVGPCVAGLAFDLAVVLRAPPAPPAEAQTVEVVRVRTATRLLTGNALGNVVGSNIASIGLVLGLAALARPVAASAKLFATVVPLAGVATLLFWFLAADKSISRVDGGILLAALAGAIVLLVRAVRQEPDVGKEAFAAWVPERFPLWLAVVLALLGAAGLVGGAMLAGAKMIEATRALRTGTFVTGATFAAVGVSLPAAVAAVLAARRGRSDLVLGLVVGPMLFNLLLVVGAVALVEPITITEHAILNEIPAMAVFSLLLVPPLVNGYRVPRWEGALLLVVYAGFILWQARKA